MTGREIPVQRPTVLVAGPFSRPFIGDWFDASSQVATCLAVDLSSDSRSAQRSEMRRRSRKLRPSRVFASLNDRLVVRQLARQLSADGVQPDLIHSHFYPTGYSLLGLQQELQVPLVHTEHSSALVAAEPMTQPARQRVRSVLQAASTVFAVGPALKNALAEIDPLANIVVVGNPVPINEPFDPVLREPGRLKVASAGNLIPRKRVDLQLEIIGELRRVAPHLGVSFTIAGSGPDESALKRLAEERADGADIEFVGELGRSDLLRLMADSDVFLHTSISETFGVVLAEALYQGTPVVTTRGGGLTDMAGDLPGLTVVERDAGPRAIAQAVIGVFESKPDRSIIRSEASRRFDPAVVREQLRHHYLAALGSSDLHR